MSIPTYDHFIEPILRHLARYPEGLSSREVQDAVAAELGLTDEERQERLPSGLQPVYKNRAGWAHDRLKRAGYSSSPKYGFWQLTEAGASFAKGNPHPLPKSEIHRLAIASRDQPARRSGVTDQAPGEDGGESVSETPTVVATPDDRLEEAIREIRSSVEGELLEQLSRVTPGNFEIIVLDLLHRMGYGASPEDVQRVGQPGDEGIDGVISLDRLGLDKVYVQAKRWKHSVGRPEVQGFFGALAGQKARRGVMITTSRFSEPAIAYARAVEGLVLIDGERLAGLMVEFQVGVSSRAVRIPKLDRDYFEDGPV